MSTINVDIVDPQSGSELVVNNVTIKSVAPSGTYSNLHIGTSGSLLPNPSGISNTTLGYQAGSALTSGTGNVIVGSNSSVVLDTGSFNTMIGNGAGTTITTGTANTFIGSNAPFVVGSITGINNIAIGQSAPLSSNTVSNEIVLGNGGTGVLRCAVTTITSLSDERDKKDIKDLSTGLEFVEALRPVEFTWNDRDESGKHNVADFGFIAQDLKKAQEDAEKAEVLKLVYDENPEKLEASYGKLIPILVKAIQELSKEITNLKNK
jgi:hypothetical protein